jgi:hypothetical protein
MRCLLPESKLPGRHLGSPASSEIDDFEVFPDAVTSFSNHQNGAIRIIRGGYRRVSLRQQRGQVTGGARSPDREPRNTSVLSAPAAPLARREGRRTGGLRLNAGLFDYGYEHEQGQNKNNQTC